MKSESNLDKNIRECKEMLKRVKDIATELEKERVKNK